MDTETEANVIQFKDFHGNEKGPHRFETSYDLRKRIVSEFRSRNRGSPGRKPSGRITFYLIQWLIREGREADAEAMKPYLSQARKDRGLDFKSENSPARQRYNARKLREREGRMLLSGEASRAKTERNEEIRFVVSAEIAEKAARVAAASGLTIGELCRVMVARIAGESIEAKVRQPELPLGL